MDVKWKETMYYGKFLKEKHTHPLEATKQLFRRAKRACVKRMKETEVWKKTMAYRRHNKTLKEIKQLYSEMCERFQRYPEASASVQE